MLYVGTMLGAFALIAITAGVASRPGLLLGLAGIATAAPGLRVVSQGAQARELISVLEATGRTQLVAGIAMTIGLLL